VKKSFFLILACGGSLFCLVAKAADALLAAPSPGAARVLIVENSAATEAFQPRPEKIRIMVNRAILQLTGKTNLALAWRSFVSTQDIVGIKVFSAPGPRSGTRPAVVAPVIEGLLAAGVPPQKIIIWDKQLVDLRQAGFLDLAQRYKVRLAGSFNAGYDEKVFYEKELIGKLIWGDLEFGRKGDGVGRKSFVSKLLTREITKIISISPLLNHNLAGVNGHLCSLALGSVDNTIRFESQAERLAIAVPDIYNLPELNDHVVLNITDALIGQYEGEQRSLLHYSTPLNQIWFSKDPVALDVLAIQELDRERLASKMPEDKKNTELYQNASLLLELGVSDPRKIRVEVVK